MAKWQPIETVPKDGSEVLLGFADSSDMDFYRWNQGLADTESPPEIRGWCDRCSDPPSAVPTHWMQIDPPR